jgi:hypothetical protein
MIEEKPKRKNDEDTYMEEWVKGEQNARRYLAVWFILITFFYFFLFNPLQYFDILGSGFITFYLLLIAAPAIAGIVAIVLSNNTNWIRSQLEQMIEKPNKINNYAGYIFIVLAVLQFIITRSAEQKFLLAPCMLGAAIYWIWRGQKYQKYLALFAEEKAR